MLFENLDSYVIKQSLMAKLQYSLGFRMIAAVKKAHQVQPINFETGKPDDSAAIALKRAKRAFISFQDYCATHAYQIDPLEAIIESYIKSTGKQPSNTPAEVIAARAKISGMNIEKLHAESDKARERAIGKQEEELNKLKADFVDLQIYTNGFFHTDAALDNSGENDHEDSYLDMEEVITDSWVAENYPKALKSQVAYWTRWNNWDDGEVLMIASDQETIAASKA